MLNNKGLVTRRPLELRLVNTKSASIPYAIFNEDPNKNKITDPIEIRNKIIEYTNNVCGSHKVISDKSIVLTLYSRDTPDLTLIDIPGITRIPIGDQPENIEELTVNIVKKFCMDDNTVIICVIPANQDISTSDGIKYAKIFDPDGERTIGVLTKVDLMDEGTDISNILLNKEIKLKYGYVAVKGRSKKDIDNNVDVAGALKIEKKFFEINEIYSKMDKSYFGTSMLVQKLTKILQKLIKKNLPDIKKNILNKRKELEYQLSKLGPEIPNEKNKKFEYIFNKIQEFVFSLTNDIIGKVDLLSLNYNSNINPKRNKKNASLYIRENFDKFIEEEIEEEFYISDDYTNDDIKDALLKYQGDSIAGFLSIDSFLSLIVPKLKKFRIPTHELLDEVTDNIRKICTSQIKEYFNGYTKLFSQLNTSLNDFINSKKQITSSIIDSMLEAEEGYLYTNQGMTKSYINDKDNKTNKYENESTLILELRTKMNFYFSTVAQNIKDYIPKIIGTYLIKEFIDQIGVFIFSELSKNNFYIESISESDENVKKRDELNKSYKILKTAEYLINNELDNKVVFNDYEEFENMNKNMDELYEISKKEYEENKVISNNVKVNKPIEQKIELNKDSKDTPKPNITHNNISNVNEPQRNSSNINISNNINNNNNINNYQGKGIFSNPEPTTDNNMSRKNIFSNNNVKDTSKLGNLFGNLNKK